MSFRVPAQKNRSVDTHKFSMIPSAEIPRSSFDVQTQHKTTFDASYLYPIYEDEVLPGDSMSLKMAAFVRLATPIVPIMDNLHLDTFFFFVPYRLLWTNFVKMMGEQDNPADSVSYTTPQKVSPVGGYTVGSLADYFGLPTVGQVGAGNTVTHSALYHRAYALCWNLWFRDENLQNSVVVDKGDGPDTTTSAVLLKRGKRKDYFTGALPWPQKGATAVSLPLGVTAPVRTHATIESQTGAQAPLKLRQSTGGAISATSQALSVQGVSGSLYQETVAGGALGDTNYPSNLYTDLTAATAATINQIRQAFQTQRMLERDARGGTRYTEHVRSHFKVVSPDARLQRPEYLGGGEHTNHSLPYSTNYTIRSHRRNNATRNTRRRRRRTTRNGLDTSIHRTRSHNWTGKRTRRPHLPTRLAQNVVTAHEARLLSASVLTPRRTGHPQQRNIL